MLRLLLALALALSPPGIILTEGGLQQKLEILAAKMPATVGIAIIIDGRETVTVNNDQRFPLMSVFKFHQALALSSSRTAGAMSSPCSSRTRASDAETEAMITDISACVHRHIAGSASTTP